jgi:hypothetical protein
MDTLDRFVCLADTLPIDVSFGVFTDASEVLPDRGASTGSGALRSALLEIGWQTPRSRPEGREEAGDVDAVVDAADCWLPSGRSDTVKMDLG